MRAGLLLLAGLSLASAGTQRQRRQLKSDKQLSRRQSSSKYAVYTLDQPIDHFPTEDRYQPHTNATFKQRYTFDASYYQPGGPVYLYVGGETSLESRLSNLETGIIQILMNATGGLGVIIENRYYGDSVPYANLTTDNLAYLTNEQTIADFAYFAQHATFPGVADNASLAAPAAPWIMYGGSLAGAQTSFTVKTYPDLIYGGIAASGVTHVAVEYPEWYDPIQKFAPQDCVASINGVVDKFDALVAANNSAAVAEVKAVFGLEALADDRDFAKTIAYPLGGPFDYPTETWQELIWTDQQAQFWEFCTAVTDLDAPANVTAVDTQLAKYSNGTAWENLGNYANYIKEVILPTCPSGNYAGGECFGAGNATWWTELVDDETRAYLYTTCIEGGLYQAAHQDGPSLISRVMDAAYTQQQCDAAFPPGRYNAIPASPDVDRWNAYGGYDVQADRLAFIDGNHDPWLDGCYHSNEAPPRQATDLRPEHLIVSGGHHWDSTGILDVAAEPQFIRESHHWEIRTVKKWLRDFSSWAPAAAAARR